MSRHATTGGHTLPEHDRFAPVGGLPTQDLIQRLKMYLPMLKPTIDEVSYMLALHAELARRTPQSTQFWDLIKSFNCSGASKETIRRYCETNSLPPSKSRNSVAKPEYKLARTVEDVMQEYNLHFHFVPQPLVAPDTTLSHPSALLKCAAGRGVGSRPCMHCRGVPTSTRWR